MEEMFAELTRKLTKSIEDAVKSAVAALKSSIEKEIEHLTKKVDNLTARVTELEESRHPTTSPDSEQPTTNQPSIMMEATQTIQTQIRQLETSVSNHQRLFERKERESRENNMVVIGIEESLDSEESKTTLNVINEFLESKMKITSIKAVQARRLGRRNPHQSQATQAHPSYFSKCKRKKSSNSKKSDTGRYQSIP